VAGRERCLFENEFGFEHRGRSGGFGLGGGDRGTTGEGKATEQKEPSGVERAVWYHSGTGEIENSKLKIENFRKLRRKAQDRFSSRRKPCLINTPLQLQRGDRR